MLGSVLAGVVVGVVAGLRISMSMLARFRPMGLCDSSSSRWMDPGDFFTRTNIWRSRPGFAAGAARDCAATRPASVTSAVCTDRVELSDVCARRQHNQSQSFEMVISSYAFNDWTVSKERRGCGSEHDVGSTCAGPRGLNAAAQRLQGNQKPKVAP
jgi:hypothetical protein